MLTLDLQLFSEAPGAAAAAPAAEAASMTSDAGAGAGNAPAQTQRVEYGRQQPQARPQQQAQQQEPARRTFEELIKGEYAEDYKKAVQGAINERFKSANAAKKQFETAQPIIKAMAAKYGVDPEDLDGLVARVNDDDSLYVDDAAKAGLPVKTYKQIKQLEAQNAQLLQQQQQTAEERALQQHFQRMTQEAEELAQIAPGFDLQAELQNERFARMTAPGTGISVKDAYFAIHHDELQRQAVAQSTRQAVQSVTNAVRSGSMRPSENGIGNAGGTQAKADPRAWTSADYAEVRRRVKAGEKIYL